MQATVLSTAARTVLRPVISVVPMNRFGIVLARTFVAGALGALGSQPAGTRVIPVRAGAVVGEWVLAPGVEPPKAAPDTKAIYYMHGSAYMMCSARTHRSLVARLSAVTGQPVFVVDYRLAPEHPFPAAADDIAGAYRWLLDQGFAPTQLSIAGDSAGGHLTADLLINLAADGQPMPGAVALFSPLIDLTFDLATRRERANPDPVITAAGGRRLVRTYTRNEVPTNPRLELDFAAAASFPPFLVQVGGAEMLVADAEYLVEQIAEHGGSATLEVWPGLMHVFQAMPRIAPEADQALLRVRDFLGSVQRVPSSAGAESDAQVPAPMR